MTEKNFSQTANSGVPMNPYAPNIPSMTWNPLNDYINRNAVQPVTKGVKKLGSFAASLIPGQSLVRDQYRLASQPGTTVTIPNTPITFIDPRNPDALKSTVKSMETGLVDYLSTRFIPKSWQGALRIPVMQTANDMLMDKIMPTKYDNVVNGVTPTKGPVISPGHMSSANNTVNQSIKDYQAGVDMVNNLKNSMGINTQGLTDVQLASLNDAKAQAKKEYDTYMSGARKDISSAELAAAKGYGENARMYQGTMTDVENALTDFDMAKSPANYGGAQQSAGRNYDLANQTLGLNTANSISNYILGGRNAANAMNRSLSSVTDRGSDYAMNNMNTLMSMIPMDNPETFQKLMALIQGGK